MKKNALTLRLAFFASWLALLGERAWVSFWALISFLLLLSALSVFGIWHWLPLAAHLALLSASALGLLFLTYKGFKNFHLPRRYDAERAIEKESGLLHRPLSLINDNMATGTNELWAASQERAAAEGAGKVKIYRPRPALAAKDPHGLRHAAALLFIISLIIMKFPQPAAVLQGLLPQLHTGATAASGIEAWITPPEYTNQPPVFLLSKKTDVAANQADIKAPAGSILHIRATGFTFAPVLKSNSTEIPLTKDSKGFLIADYTLTADTKLSLRQLWQSYLSTAITVIPDQKPEASLTEAKEAAGSMTRLKYAVKDDFGIKKLTGTIASLDRHGEPTDTEFDLPVPSSAKPDITSLQDFTRLPEAGKTVSMTLTAEDAAGNSVTTTPVEVTLPERKFTSPIAQLLIQSRKRIIGYEDPMTRSLAINDIVEAARKPAAYNEDTGLFLGMVSAINRLNMDDTVTALNSVIPLLWDMAVRLEDGGLNDAAVTAQQALQALQDALADKNTTAEELKQLVAAAQAAMQKYMQSLAGQMQQRFQQGQKPVSISSELASRLMKNIDMGQMMRQMQAMGQTGSRDALQRMAEQMQQSLQSLDPTRMGEMDPKAEAALQALDQLPALIRAQQFLLDRTRFMEEGEKDADMTTAQTKLQTVLHEIIQDLGQALKIPPALLEAEGTMKQAIASLQKAKNADAAAAQTKTLEALQKGTEDATEAMAQAMQQQMMLMPGQSGKPNGGNQDPLGRGDGKNNMSDVEIPAEQERSRVQDIMRELRDRSNEQKRPKQERDYLDRLLDTFN